MNGTIWPVILFAMLGVHSSAYAQDWQWAVDAGQGGNVDHCYDIATDSQGNAYWVGTVSGSSVDFGGVFVNTNGEIHAVIAKYDSLGNFLWVRSVYSQFYSTWAYGIHIDKWDHVYMTGHYRGTADFGSGITLPGSGSGKDMFLVRYDAVGNTVWARKAGANSSTEEGRDVVTDDDGEFVYVTGTSNGQTMAFDTLVLNNSPYYGGAFIAKYDSAGAIQWAHRSLNTNNFGITLPNGLTFANDRLFIAGQNQYGTLTFGNLVLAAVPGNHLFVVSYDTNGNAVWGRAYSGGDNEAKSIAADTLGNLFIAARVAGAIWIGTDTLTATPGDDDIFIMKMDQSGNAEWAMITGSTERDLAWDVSVDNLGNAYFAGQFHNTTDLFGQSLTSWGGEEVFVIKVAGDGDLLWAQRGGNSNRDVGLCVHHDPRYPDHVYMGGYFWGAVTYGSSVIDDVQNGDAMMVQMKDTTIGAFASASIVCPGACNGTAIATSNGVPPFSYLWNTGPTSQSINGLCEGFYSVQITDGSGAVWVDTVEVASWNDPNFTVNSMADSLWINGGTSWQWSYNNMPIVGANSVHHLAQQSGNYFVTVEAANGCSWNSDTVNVVLTVGLDQPDLDLGLQIFPNPVHDVLHIDSPSKVLSVVATNALGQRIELAVHDQTIDVSELLNGIWSFRFGTPNGVKVMNVVVLR